nr:hydrogenase expression/formation protein HypE [Litorivivens lipolytica]
MSQGAGGRDMQRLLDDVIYQYLDPLSLQRDDAATFALNSLAQSGDRLAFTTDTYTVSPLRFRGGDIGALAVNGTVNDLACSGAIPRFLSLSLIIEEGFALEELRFYLQSLQQAAHSAEVTIVTGDTKVMPRGAIDGLVINTSGLGVIPSDRQPGIDRLKTGDTVIVSGFIGDHGTAILGARSDLQLDIDVTSDCKAITPLTELLFAHGGVRFVRDATRGGLAAVLNEIASSSQQGVRVRETAIPVRPAVRSTCELLGFDPLSLANEGTFVAVLAADTAGSALEELRRHPHGLHATAIGEITDRRPGKVELESAFGATRLLDMPRGELLPRIC